MEEEHITPEDWQNPIDKDKVAENPHLLPYAHTVGGVEIRPVDRGKIKGKAMAAMYEQTDRQLDQIREQIALLARQASAIQDRVRISERIYQAVISFDPHVGQTCYLYHRDSGDDTLSLVGPHEWGNNPPMHYVATVRLLADHTWEILDDES